ncbi:MAG: MoaD/ThiS family protein [Planctomycetota bacterium]|jgi:molybdopterin converting factor small subunit
MARVVLTSNLRRYTGGITEIDAPGERVCDLLAALDGKLPGLRHYLVNDQGALRRHVDVFVDGEAVGDRAQLTDALQPTSTVHILQALSGG